LSGSSRGTYKSNVGVLISPCPLLYLSTTSLTGILIVRLVLLVPARTHVLIIKESILASSSIKMQPISNRLGLGLRPPLPSYGQGPSMSALAQQQQMLHQGFVPPQAQKQTTLFVGSISGGVTDSFLNRLLEVIPSL
jgi:hypothetical protein